MLNPIVLAAGKSTRFGSNKLTHSLARGSTILQATVDLYTRAFGHITVVIPSQGQSIYDLLNGFDVSLVESPNAEAGMSQSLIAGIKANPDAAAWMIALADMPFVNEETLLRLAEYSADNRIVQPVYRQQAGHPVIFGRQFEGELLSLTGDRGAKPVIDRHLGFLTQVDVDDQGVTLDLDHPSDIPL